MSTAAEAPATNAGKPARPKADAAARPSEEGADGLAHVADLKVLAATTDQSGQVWAASAVTMLGRLGGRTVGVVIGHHHHALLRRDAAGEVRRLRPSALRGFRLRRGRPGGRARGGLADPLGGPGEAGSAVLQVDAEVAAFSGGYATIVGATVFLKRCLPVKGRCTFE